MSMTCQSCAFWNHTNTQTIHGFDNQNGRCVRHPPLVVYDGDSASTEWPWTRPDDYCGEYEGRETGFTSTSHG